jgi:hypothetical protein
MEVIEHGDPPRLNVLERVVFGAAKPGAVVVTTPNSEYDVNYEGLTGCATMSSSPTATSRPRAWGTVTSRVSPTAETKTFGPAANRALAAARLTSPSFPGGHRRDLLGV